MFQPTIARWVSFDKFSTRFTSSVYTFMNNSPFSDQEVDLLICESKLRKIVLLWAFPYPCAAALMSNFLSGRWSSYCPDECIKRLKARGFDYIDSCIADYLKHGQHCNSNVSFSIKLNGMQDFAGSPMDDLGRGALSPDQDLAFALGRICWQFDGFVGVSCEATKRGSCCCDCTAAWGGDIKIRDKYRFCHSNPPNIKKHHPLWCACLLEKANVGKVYRIQCPLTLYARQIDAFQQCPGPPRPPGCICQTRSTKRTDTEAKGVDCGSDSLCAKMLDGRDW